MVPVRTLRIAQASASPDEGRIEFGHSAQAVQCVRRYKKWALGDEWLIVRVFESIR